MAHLALGAEPAIMDIFLRMTRNARPAEHRRRGTLGGNVGGQFMAGVTISFSVGAIEPEACLAVVEVPRLPGTGAMACLALDTKHPFVYILLLVTTVAVPGRLPKRRSQVAFLAFDPTVAAGQRETGTVVIKLVDLPAALLMAGVATLAQLALVTLLVIILPMARIAVGRQLL